MSRGTEIRPVSPVNVVGTIDGDPTVLARITSGAEIVVDTAGSPLSEEYPLQRLDEKERSRHVVQGGDMESLIQAKAV